MIMGQFKCSNDFIKYGKFLQKFQLVIRAVQIFRLYYQNFLVLRKFQSAIIGTVQISKSLQQICLIFAKISARDRRRSDFFFSPLMCNHTTSSQLYYKYLQKLQRLHAKYAQSAKTTELNLRNTARKTLDMNAMLALSPKPNKFAC